MAVEPPEVKEYRKNLRRPAGSQHQLCCPECQIAMMRWGGYFRTDMRCEDGEVLEPLWIQRWRCKEHGTHSVLPNFLSRCGRYLVSVVAKVCEWMSRKGKKSFPDEVTGPSADSGRRWWTMVSSPQIGKWLEKRVSLPSQNSLSQSARNIALARTLARRLKLHPDSFPRLLQAARLAVLAN